MALELKLKFDGVDRTGRVLTLRDGTGVYNAASNPGGWGVPNVAPTTVEKLVFTVSHYDSNEVSQQVYVVSPDPDYPDYYTDPAVINILNGTPIQLTSLSLGETEPEEGLLAFSDGVYDFNYYAVVEPVFGVSGSAGDIYLTGIDFEPYYDADAVVIDEVIYDIDKSINTNGFTLLYLTKPLESNTTSFRPVYRGNTKGIVEALSDCLLLANSGKIASQCGCGKNEKALQAAEILSYKLCAKMDFSSNNYAQSNAMLKAAVKAAKWYFKGNCGC